MKRWDSKHEVGNIWGAIADFEDRASHVLRNVGSLEELRAHGRLTTNKQMGIDPEKEEQKVRATCSTIAYFENEDSHEPGKAGSL